MFNLHQSCVNCYDQTITEEPSKPQSILQFPDMILASTTVNSQLYVNFKLFLPLNDPLLNLTPGLCKGHLLKIVYTASILIINKPFFICNFK